MLIRLFDQPFSLDGLGATLWYVYMHGIFGDADDAPEGGDLRQIVFECFLLIPHLESCNSS